jgi:hypothetical protein
VVGSRVVSERQGGTARQVSIFVVGSRVVSERQGGTARQVSNS